MLTNPSLYDQQKRKALAEVPLTLDQKYAILEGLLAEARALGKFNEHDLLDGLEDTIRLAAALNKYVSTPPR